jgi:hypothetical protein
LLRIGKMRSGCFNGISSRTGVHLAGRSIGELARLECNAPNFNVGGIGRMSSVEPPPFKTSVPPLRKNWIIAGEIGARARIQQKLKCSTGPQ